jgi:protein TonB
VSKLVADDQANLKGEGVPVAQEGGKAPRLHPWRSYVFSSGLHLGVLLVAVLLVRETLPNLEGSDEVATHLRVAELPEPIQLTEEVIEPPPEVKEHTTEPEPDLVEAPFVPTKELPPEPESPEPLDWIPPKEMFEHVEDFSPEPEPKVEPQAVVQETVPPKPEVPVVLSGSQLPHVLEGPLPSYPRHAVRMRWQGTVVLHIRVAAEGHVVDVVVHRSSGHTALDESAVKTFKRWVFRERVDGEAEIRLLQKPFTFRL